MIVIKALLELTRVYGHIAAVACVILAWAFRSHSYLYDSLMFVAAGVAFVQMLIEYPTRQVVCLAILIGIIGLLFFIPI